MRNAFADEVTKLGMIDPRIVLLTGDIGNKLFDQFKDGSKERFFNCGIAEVNMMGVAAGMASCGLIPWLSSFACFLVNRDLDQLRVVVAQYDGDAAHRFVLWMLRAPLPRRRSAAAPRVGAVARLRRV